jgi:multimeric flavodoxin WrbA
MSKILLGILGSPRKYGNSELFVKELYRQLPEGWKLNLIRLPELSIQPCRACYQCLFGEMKCPQKDDFYLVLDALARSDAYVVAAPVYFLGANASLKNFLDRGLSFYGRLDELWGKPAVGCAIAGIEDMEGYTKLAIDSFIKLTLGDHRGSGVVYGALPGEILLDGAGKEVAAQLAEALIAGKAAITDPATPVCPLCGGDTFRFMPGGKIRCMLCSSLGDYAWEEGLLQLRIAQGEHPLFLTYEDAKKHGVWLRGMKEKFLARRKELKTVTQEYIQEGEWIRPEKAGSEE